MWIYYFLDYFFICFHFSIVLFNLFGWIWKKYRIFNLSLLMLTAASWFGLGLFYGIGYCPLTEWHWQVIAKLGSRPAETSYFQMLIRRMSGIRLSSALVDTVTLYSYFMALGVSIILNTRDWRQNRKQRRVTHFHDQ